MAIIKNGVPTEGLRGKVGGLVYSRVGDRVIVRGAPIFSESAMDNPVKKEQTSMFSMIRKYCKAHYKVFRETFDQEGFRTAAHNFHTHNHQAMKCAFAELFERSQSSGKAPTISEMDEAVERYAREHPNEILLAYKQGYKPVYFNGTWPDVIEIQPENPHKLSVLVVPVEK